MLNFKYIEKRKWILFFIGTIILIILLNQYNNQLEHNTNVSANKKSIFKCILNKGNGIKLLNDFITNPGVEIKVIRLKCKINNINYYLAHINEEYNKCGVCNTELHPTKKYMPILIKEEHIRKNCNTQMLDCINKQHHKLISECKNEFNPNGNLCDYKFPNKIDEKYCDIIIKRDLKNKTNYNFSFVKENDINFSKLLGEIRLCLNSIVALSDGSEVQKNKIQSKYYICTHHDDLSKKSNALKENIVSQVKIEEKNGKFIIYFDASENKKSRSGYFGSENYYIGICNKTIKEQNICDEICKNNNSLSQEDKKACNAISYLCPYNDKNDPNIIKFEFEYVRNKLSSN